MSTLGDRVFVFDGDGVKHRVGGPRHLLRSNGDVFQLCLERERARVALIEGSRQRVARAGRQCLRVGQRLLCDRARQQNPCAHQLGGRHGGDRLGRHCQRLIHATSLVHMFESW